MTPPYEPDPADAAHPADPVTLVGADEPSLLREARVVADNRRQARAHVALAQGVLVERYRLPSAESAFALLKESSQRHNVKLHTLADAVLRVPGPQRGARAWFPGRARFGPPPLDGLDVDPGARGAQGAVLGAVLQRVLAITQTPMGNVQVAEGSRLRLERHAGLDRPFTDFFAFVEGPTTSCAQAAAQCRQVTVTDVATEPVFDEESRAVILRSGSRACHSVPLAAPSGVVLGMVSAHYDRPVAAPARAQAAALGRTAAVAGRWLSWHRRTVVLDALEELHGVATSGRG